MQCQRTSETQKESLMAAANGKSASKIKRTLSKKNSSKNGLSNKELVESLISNISLAKGLLAALSLGQQSDWIKKLERTPPEHMRILLQDVMDEIYSAEMSLSTLMSQLEKKYMGICLL